MLYQKQSQFRPLFPLPILFLIQILYITNLSKQASLQPPNTSTKLQIQIQDNNYINNFETQQEQNQNKIGQKLAIWGHQARKDGEEGQGRDGLLFEHYWRVFGGQGLFGKNQQFYQFRKQIFQQNVRQIISHNKKKFNTFLKSINQFILLSKPQFLQFHVPKKRNLQTITLTQQQTQTKTQTQTQTQTETTPTIKLQVDWSCHSRMPIKLPFCIASHVQASLGVIEIMINQGQGQGQVDRDGQNQGKYLSVQEVMACGGKYGISICESGNWMQVYEYALQQGIGYEYLYPLSQYNPTSRYPKQKCNNQLINSPQYKTRKIFPTNYIKITSNNCKQLSLRLQHGPAVAQVSAISLAFYSSGTYNLPLKIYNEMIRPGSESIYQFDHTVQVVGYDGWKQKQRGFLILNNWGRRWGIGGYAWLGDYSGVCVNAGYPVLGGQQRNLSLIPCLKQRKQGEDDQNQKSISL